MLCAEFSYKAQVSSGSVLQKADARERLSAQGDLEVDNLLRSVLRVRVDLDCI